MCSKKQTEFAIFIIHRLAQVWHKQPNEVFHILQATHILDDYIIAHYDVLHTLGEQYLVEDISEFARERGAVL